jgi:hypothetical protein
MMNYNIYNDLYDSYSEIQIMTSDSISEIQRMTYDSDSEIQIIELMSKFVTCFSELQL